MKEPMHISHESLEILYRTYSRKRFIHPDPIEFLFKYPLSDREIVGLLAALLAYGRVAQILKSVQDALDRLSEPLVTTTSASRAELCRMFRGFKHRFTTGGEVAALLFAAGKIIADHGSLGHFVAAAHAPNAPTILPAMKALTDALTDEARGECPSLVSDPGRGSACKRLNLYFRWMIRKDRIDPGGWPVSPSILMVPLDTHMHRFALSHGLTARKAADMKTAIEITDGFRRFNPKDPVKYDFALTRLGILKTAGYAVGSRT